MAETQEEMMNRFSHQALLNGGVPAAEIARMEGFVNAGAGDDMAKACRFCCGTHRALMHVIVDPASPPEAKNAARTAASLLFLDLKGMYKGAHDALRQLRAEQQASNGAIATLRTETDQLRVQVENRGVVIDCLRSFTWVILQCMGRRVSNRHRLNRNLFLAMRDNLTFADADAIDWDLVRPIQGFLEFFGRRVAVMEWRYQTARAERLAAAQNAAAPAAPADPHADPWDRCGHWLRRVVR